MKWDYPLTNAIAPGPDAAQSIINSWNLFNERDAFIADMYKLYPTSLRIAMVVLFEEYSIPFSSYLDKKSYQHVAEDGMHIPNHGFD